MRRGKFLSLIFFSLLFLWQESFAETVLRLPDGMRVRELNPDEKEKLQNVEGLEMQDIPVQYKGEVEFKERREPFHWRDARIFGGIGFGYSSISETKMKKSKTDTQVQTETGQNSTVYLDQNELALDDAFAFFGSLGFYWPNGFKLEAEYRQAVYKTTKMDEFQFTVGTDKIWEYIYDNDTGSINTVPITEMRMDIKTAMINFIFEPSSNRTKLTPYAGFGGGLVIADVETLPSTGSAKAFGGQGMVGLAYRLGNGGSAYAGYRFVQSGSLKQTFRRAVQVSGASPNYTVYNIKSEEEFDYKSHNIDVGVRFLF